MQLLGLPTPLNRKHLLDFLNFSKTLRTHPHISSLLPNFCNCLLLQLTVVPSKQLFTFDFIKISLFICLSHRYAFITYGQLGSKGEDENLCTGSTVNTKTSFVHWVVLVFFSVSLDFAQGNKTNAFQYDLSPLK